MNKDILAKSVCYGEKTLIDHTLACCVVCDVIFKKFLDINNIRDYMDIDNPTYLYELSMMAVALHDIGKINPSLQEYYRGNRKKKLNDSNLDDSDDEFNVKDNEEQIFHNVLSWAYLKEKTTLESSKYNDITANILHHHVLRGNYKDSASSIISKMDDDTITHMNDFFLDTIKFLNDEFGINSIRGEEVKLSDNNSDCTAASVSIYPQMFNHEKNSLNVFSRRILIRTLLIFSDRFVSSLDVNDTKKVLERNYDFINSKINNFIYADKNIKTLSIDKMINCGYDKNRLEKQFKVCDTLNKSKNNILFASAGFGKTLTGLIWSSLSNKRTIWVTPTNNIAESTYISVLKEITKIGADVSIGLYYGGEWKHGNDDCDITITNIDTFLGYTIKNNICHNMLRLLSSNIIFDEYDSFLCSPKAPMFAAFVGMIHTLATFTPSRLLLMSATDDRYDKVFFINGTFNHVNGDVYGSDTKIEIKINEMADIKGFDVDKSDSLSFLYSVPDVTSFGINNIDKDVEYMHSHFPESYKEAMTQNILKKHGRNTDSNTRKSAIGTSCMGRALDITSSKVNDFVVSPNETIQRGVGRLDRFSEYSGVVTYEACLIKKGNKYYIPKVLSFFDEILWNKWINILKTHNNRVITKGEFYGIYNKFRTDNEKEYNNFFIRRFKESAKELVEMKPYASSNKPLKKNLLPNGRKTFRGESNSIYVVAYDKDGNLCEPIKMSREYIEHIESNISSASLKGQYAYFKKLFNNKELKYKYKISKWLDMKLPNKYNIARDINSPLLLTKEEAVFIEKIGLHILMSNH